MPGLPAKPVIDVLLQVDEHWCLRRRGEPHDDDRDRYAATKSELSTRDWKYAQDYADAKTGILAKALR